MNDVFMREDPLTQKSYALALDVARRCVRIQKDHKEYVLTKQLLSSGTSIGANIEEASQAASKKDFVAKLTIALKEAHETRYWLRLLRDMQLCTTAEADELIARTHEIIKMLVSSIKTVRSSLGEQS